MEKVDLAVRYGELDREAQVEFLDQLAHRAATGELEALDGLLAVIDRHKLTGPAIGRLIVDATSVQDVHQDVLIRVAQGVHTFRGNARFSTWLYRVCRNTAVDHLRRQRPATSFDDEMISDAQRVSSIVASRADIRVSLAALPEHYRDVVILRDVEGLSYEAVAEQLGLPINTVRSRLVRGRAMAATLLGGR